MGNDMKVCTPTIANKQLPNGATGPACCQASLATIKKTEELFEPCLPTLGAGRGLEPLTDQECADIALVQATVRGELQDVQKALGLGASPNTIADLTLRMGEPKKKGRKGRAIHTTPLMRACEMGHEDIVHHLLKAKASPIMCDSHGWTPLCHALAAGEATLARLLIDQPGIKLKRQKEICLKNQTEILHKCVNEVSQEVADSVLKEFGPEGFLDAGNVDMSKIIDFQAKYEEEHLHDCFSGRGAFSPQTAGEEALL
jgi:hypothetical protein